MKTERELLKQALMALKEIKGWTDRWATPGHLVSTFAEKAIKPLESALAQPEQSVAGYCKKIEELIVERDHLKAALAQQEQPAITMQRLAQYKLDALLSEGYTVNGYAIVRNNATGTVTRGCISDGGMVCWWSDRDDEPAQPKREALTQEQRKAIVICFASEKVSVSEIQRKLAIGYSEAERLCQSLVDCGLVDGLEISPSLNRQTEAAHGIKELLK